MGKVDFDASDVREQFVLCHLPALVVGKRQFHLRG